MSLFRGSLVFLLALIALSKHAPARSAVAAQAAATTPGGTPNKGTKSESSSASVTANAPQYAKEALIILEHSSLIRFSADGLGERTDTMRVKMQSDAAVRALGVLTFSYESSFEHVDIVYLRVRKPDGTVVTTSDQEAQDMPSAVTRTAPMYSDTREKQIPVKSLSVGDTLEYQVKIVRTAAEAPGQFWYAQNFILSNVVLAESVELHVPKKKYVQAASPLFTPEKKDEGDETVYRWKNSQLLPSPVTEEEKKTLQKKVKAQTKQPDIMVTSYQSWAKVGEWYRSLARERVAATPAVKAKADEVTRELKTDDEKARAIYAYVSTQIRYISISFGAGRYQPHAADEVLANQYGDCKDKDTLLQAMLQAEGIQASAVLIGSSLKLNPDVPTPAQFDHVITVVQLGKERIWLDSTPEVAPYQMLLQPLRDKQALLIPATGTASIVTTPANPPFATFFNVTATATLDSAGTIKGQMEVTTRGDSEVYFRSALHQTARAQWQELLQNVSYAEKFSGTVSNVDAMLPEKTAEPLHYSYDYERKEFGDWGNRRIPALLPPVDLTYPGDDKPDEPIDLMAIDTEELRSTISLPDGYTAQMPDGLNLKSDIADYSSTYAFKDKKIVVTRRLTIKSKKVPLAEWEDYKKFQKQVADDYGQMIQLYSGNDLKQEAADAGNPEAQRLVQQAFQEIHDQKLSQAAETLDNAEKANPEQWGLWAGRGYLHQQKREVDASLKDYRMEIKLHPTNRGAYEAMIWTESHLGKQDEIVPTLEQMKAAFPDDTEVEVRLGNALMSKKEYAKAVPLFADAVKSQPDDKRYAVRLGSAQLKAGMRAEGETTLKGALAATTDPLTLNDAAYELADAEMEFQLADDSCRRSLALQDEKTASIEASAVEKKDFSNVDLLESTWDTMGWVLFKEGKFSEAVTYLEPAWRLSQSRLVGYHLGQVYEAMGKKADALHTYELALSSLAPGATESDKIAMNERAEKLAAGKVLELGSKRTEELLKMRTVDLPEIGKGYKTADFNLVWSKDGLQEVAFVKGDEELRPTAALLKKANPPQPLPPDSKAKLLRRGIMACSDITKSCQMVLMYPQDAVSQQAAPITIEKK